MRRVCLPANWASLVALHVAVIHTITTSYHARPGGRLTQRHRIPHAPVDTSRSVVRSIAVVTASFANPPPHRARRGRLDVRDALVRLCGPSAVLMARGAATRRRRMADRTRATGCDSEERMPLICPANLSL